MTTEEGNMLPPGLYRLHWHEGGSSLAAVGVSSSGERWIAPTNWVNGVCSAVSKWKVITRAERIHTVDDPHTDQTHYGPQMISYRRSEIDALLDVIDQSITPKVTYTGDISEMSFEASEIRTNALIAVRKLLGDAPK